MSVRRSRAQLEPDVWKAVKVAEIEAQAEGQSVTFHDIVNELLRQALGLSSVEPEQDEQTGRKPRRRIGRED